MNLFVTGLSHKTAPIAIRERLAFSGDDLEVALGRVRRLPGIHEAVMLCTCNRTEVYALASNPQAGAEEVADWMDQRTAGDLTPHLYRHTGEDALVHLFSVSASLDSMVVGEPQILGQVKEAFATARRHKATGRRIERIFSRAFQVAKRVRNETGVGENAVSMSFVAVELAKKVFGQLDGKAVLLVGAGEMSELAAENLAGAGVDRVVVANRSQARARELAQKFGGEARGLSSLGQLLGEVDIVLSSTAAPSFLITPELLTPAVKARRHRPLLLIDLAVPRDIDPAVNELSNVYSYDVDDMQRVVEENLQTRSQEATRGLRLVHREVTTFLDEDKARAVRPVLTALRHVARQTADAEVEKTLHKLAAAGLTEAQQASVAAMGQAIIKKLLHEPTVLLRSMPTGEEGERLAAAVTTLFGLDVEAINEAVAEAKQKRRDERGPAEVGKVVPLKSGK